MVRFSKQQQKPHLHFQLNALNLEIAIQARKEHNFQLASRHLVQNLDTDQVIFFKLFFSKFDLKRLICFYFLQDLMTYVGGINFNNSGMFLSTDKANCLRQSAKLGYVLQPNIHETGNYSLCTVILNIVHRI